MREHEISVPGPASFPTAIDVFEMDLVLSLPRFKGASISEVDDADTLITTTATFTTTHLLFISKDPFVSVLSRRSRTLLQPLSIIWK